MRLVNLIPMFNLSDIEASLDFSRPGSGCPLVAAVVRQSPASAAIQRQIRQARRSGVIMIGRCRLPGQKGAHTSLCERTRGCTGARRAPI